MPADQPPTYKYPLNADEFIFAFTGPTLTLPSALMRYGVRAWKG